MVVVVAGEIFAAPGRWSAAWVAPWQWWGSPAVWRTLNVGSNTAIFKFFYNTKRPLQLLRISGFDLFINLSNWPLKVVSNLTILEYFSSLRYASCTTSFCGRNW
jgi:hypothetical protein